ncbi:BON domain-containing protein [Peredibacter starrii]|uniref:BON domain-containing protein n=1 Tax=Peredibacter starrii TaxID=28202 RepID=A0AAX4HVH1_9BACT|nr:BON domain-containing protein [Peredibacter starrii]WPU66960.1 BON domain-containing protein [Peredibacter starrii]
MGRIQSGNDQRGFSRFRDSDYFEEPRFDTDGSFTHSNFSFDDKEFGRDLHEKRGRFGGVNRFGEQRIHHDSYQDDQFRNDYDPTYEDEYGMKHPYEHGGRLNRWSDDIRSEASRENHYGKGPKGYQRSDTRIMEDACEILLDSPEVDASEIEVKVNDRVITLEGEVVSRRDKRMAEELIENISGVLDVQNRLKVKHSADGWIPGLGYAGRDQYGL